MKIMEIVSGHQVNGAVQHALLLARELSRRGHEITVVCRPNSWLSGQLAGEHVDVVHSDLHRWPLDELRRIASAAQSRGIAVLHTHMSRAHFFGVLLRRLCGIPCVATAHSRHIQLHWMFNDLVIAPSDATRRFHHRFNLVPAKRIETIPNFIDYHRLARYETQPRSRVRQQLGVGDDDQLLGVVGNVIPRKGQLDLIKALPRILPAAPRVKVVLAGELNREYARECREWAALLEVSERIIWAGARNDIPDLLGALDLFVLPSLEETFPLSILEAMAAGVPVVATSVGGVSECIESEVNGLLVPPARPDALAGAIVRVLASPDDARRLTAQGRRVVVDRYSSEAVVTRVEQAFQRLCKPRARRSMLAPFRRRQPKLGATV